MTGTNVNPARARAAAMPPETDLPASPRALRRRRPVRRELRAMAMVWRRELISYWRNRVRMFVTFVQPVVFLFVLGTGIQAENVDGGGFPYRTYIFPGVMALAVMMPAFLSAGTVVYDREFGFLREMLVAPVRRSSIVIGKCLGGATVATFHGLVIMAFGPLVGVPYNTRMILALTGLLLLLSFTVVALSVAVAVKLAQFQSFMAIVNLITFPFLLLSGAMFPLAGLPTWLAVMTRLDPLAYIVDPMRRVVYPHVNYSEPVASRTWLVPPELRVTWGERYIVPLGYELGMVALLSAAMLALAIFLFNRNR